MKGGGLALENLIQPTISLEMPVPSQGHDGFHSFPVDSKPSEANVKNNFTSHIDKKIFLTFFLTSLSLYIFTI
jgi:hypothetical protein